MDRSRTPDSERRSSVRVDWAAALELVLPTGGRKPGEPGTDACDRRAVLAEAVLWQSPDGQGVGRESKAGTTSDATDGHRGDLPETQNDRSSAEAQDLPVFAAKCEDSATGPGMEHRHHVHPDASRLLVPRGCDGLVQPSRAVVAIVEHDGQSILPGSTGDRSLDEAARDLQQRPRLPVHVHGVHKPAGGVWCGDQHGWPRPSVGQRVHRTPVAERQVRGGLPEGLRHGLGGRGVALRVLSFLLPRTDPSVARLPDARRGLHRVGVDRPATCSVGQKTTANRSPEVEYQLLLRTKLSFCGRAIPVRGSRAASNPYTLNNLICCPKNGVHFHEPPDLPSDTITSVENPPSGPSGGNLL